MGESKRIPLYRDDYSNINPGPLTEGKDGPYREMHAQAIQPNDNSGGWSLKVGHWGLPKNVFHCVETPAGKQLLSVAAATVFDNAHIAKGEIGRASCRERV